MLELVLQPVVAPGPRAVGSAAALALQTLALRSRPGLAVRARP